MFTSSINPMDKDYGLYRISIASHYFFYYIYE